jgi:hypothetical protein
MVNIITINGITFNESIGHTGWTLVYSIGGTEADLFQSVGKTATMKVIEEFTTEIEGVSRITSLGMTRKASMHPKIK